jgi:hypothetical protein
MTERTLIELCAAIRDVEVIYSPRKMGTKTACSAIEMTLDTATPRIGLATVLPPKNA